jgi:hypothetical protein
MLFSKRDTPSLAEITRTHRNIAQSAISKILERAILKRLNAFIAGHNQFGFRAAHSTFSSAQ